MRKASLSDLEFEIQNCTTPHGSGSNLDTSDENDSSFELSSGENSDLEDYIIEDEEDPILDEYDPNVRSQYAWKIAPTRHQPAKWLKDFTATQDPQLANFQNDLKS